MDRWRDDMMRMWNRMTHEFVQVMNHQPRYYITEEPDAVILECEMPGVDPAAVDLETDGQCVTVRGTWPPAPAGVDSTRRTGAFQLTVNLPAEVDPDGARARFRHGLLTVELPKAAGPRRRLPIDIEGDRAAPAR
jgi:HSP20 family protein